MSVEGICGLTSPHGNSNYFRSEFVSDASLCQKGVAVTTIYICRNANIDAYSSRSSKKFTQFHPTSISIIFTVVKYPNFRSYIGSPNVYLNANITSCDCTRSEKRLPGKELHGRRNLNTPSQQYVSGWRIRFCGFIVMLALDEKVLEI
jgi:hypothetical protein